jgi:hypothetical protein
MRSIRERARSRRVERRRRHRWFVARGCAARGARERHYSRGAGVSTSVRGAARGAHRVKRKPARDMSNNFAPRANFSVDTARARS